MYQTIDGFLQSWTYEAESTQKMLDSLTDASLSQEIAPGHWTLGRVAWHIVTAIPVILSGTGLKFEGETKDYPVPTSAKTIADEYRKVNAAFVEALQSEWTNKDLATINDFFGRPMTKGKSGDGMIVGLSAEKGEFISQSGELVVKDSSVQELNIKSTTGDNYITNVSNSNMNITSTSGEVLLKDMTEGKSLFIETKSGDIGVRYKGVPASLNVA